MRWLESFKLEHFQTSVSNHGTEFLIWTWIKKNNWIKYSDPAFCQKSHPLQILTDMVVLNMLKPSSELSEENYVSVLYLLSTLCLLYLYLARNFRSATN